MKILRTVGGPTEGSVGIVLELSKEEREKFLGELKIDNLQDGSIHISGRFSRSEREELLPYVAKLFVVLRNSLGESSIDIEYLIS